MYLTCQDHGSFQPARRVIALSVWIGARLGGTDALPD
jgi:hypothetical protein